MTGWITPSGRFVSCKNYKHLDIVKNDKEFQLPEIKEIFQNLKEIKKSCLDAEKREGSTNAEWHIYEIAQDNLSGKIIKLLYRSKFIRVGEVDGILYFEAFPNVIKKKMQFCKDFAEQHGKDYKFEPMR